MKNRSIYFKGPETKPPRLIKVKAELVIDEEMNEAIEHILKRAEEGVAQRSAISNLLHLRLRESYDEEKFFPVSTDDTPDAQRMANTETRTRNSDKINRLSVLNTILSLAAAGCSLSDLVSEVNHELDPLGLNILEELKAALHVCNRRHGQEMHDQTIGLLVHIESFISDLKSRG